jgi:hypothetical protein
MTCAVARHFGDTKGCGPPRSGEEGVSLEATAFCQKMAEAFVAGDVETIAALHVVPLAVYLPDGLEVRMTRAELAAVIAKRRALALEVGMADIRSIVLVIDAMEDGRLPLTCEWVFLDRDGRPITRNRMRLFCRRSSEGELLIEMVEMVRFGFPEPP